MKNVLLVSSGIQEINRMRRYFDTSFSIKATSSVQSAAFVTASSGIGLVLYNIGVDYRFLFPLYKELRQSKKTEEIPLFVLADVSVLKPLNDCVDLLNTKLIGSAITRDNMRKLIYESFNEIPPEYS